MKKEIKIDYYDRFICIADKCSFTCCQEWKIAVDDDTYSRWDQLGLTKQEARCIKTKDSVRVIELNNQKKCPFLSDQKLCNLVLNYGEKALSETCTIFPRQIHKFTDRTEYSLVSCCPEVVDFLNQQDKINFTVNMLSMDEDILFKIRTMMITIMQDRKYSISKGMMMIYYNLLDIYQKETIARIEVDEYIDKAVLKELSEGIDNMKFDSIDTFEESNELFLDLIQNYQKEELYSSHLEPIAALAESYSQDYDQQEMVVKCQKFEREFSAYERLFRNYLVSEIFTNSLIPESDLKSMIVMIQWIAMEYVMIKHTIFLNWLLDESRELSYPMVRDCMVVISRMTGYDQEDIYEYLEKSFEDIIWDWGYLALLIGLH